MTATDAFANARAGIAATNASVWERDLVELIAHHGSTEGKLLSKYRDLGEQSESPAVRYLVNLIMTDEERHHKILAEMANAIAWGWPAESPEAAVPDLTVGASAREELREQTKTLLAFEEADRRELEKLRKSLKDVGETTMWRLLIDLMIKDTEKHIHILRFVLDLTGRALA